MHKTTFVIAGNFREYVEYKAKKAWSNTSFRFVANKDSLRGQKNLDGVAIGTWYKRHDIKDILFAIFLQANSPRKIKAYKELEQQYGVLVSSDNENSKIL
jgi:hypothetical protein